MDTKAKTEGVQGVSGEVKLSNDNLAAMKMRYMENLAAGGCPGGATGGVGASSGSGSGNSGGGGNIHHPIPMMPANATMLGIYGGLGLGMGGMAPSASSGAGTESVLAGQNNFFSPALLSGMMGNGAGMYQPGQGNQQQQQQGDLMNNMSMLAPFWGNLYQAAYGGNVAAGNFQAMMAASWLYNQMQQQQNARSQIIQPIVANLYNRQANGALPGSCGELDKELSTRCRRTDGKRWRCNREVVAGHNYCERHLHSKAKKQQQQKALKAAAPDKPASTGKDKELQTTMESDVKVQPAKEDETRDELACGPCPGHGTNDDYSASQMPSTLSGDASGTDCDNGHTSTNKPAPAAQSTVQSAVACDSSSIFMQAKSGSQTLQSDLDCKKTKGTPPSSPMKRSINQCETKTSSTANGNLSVTVSVVAEGERCRRTDGKNWRCSSRAVPSHHFCEKHLEHMARSHAKRRKLAQEKAMLKASSKASQDVTVHNMSPACLATANQGENSLSAVESRNANGGLPQSPASKKGPAPSTNEEGGSVDPSVETAATNLLCLTTIAAT